MTKETLEEAAEKHINDDLDLYESLVDGHISYNIGIDLLNKLFKDGANWQAERMYSEEDMLFAYKQGARLALLSQSELSLQKGKFPTPSEWIKQFKKK